MVIDLEVYYDFNERISTHVNDKRMQKSKSAHQITVGGIKTRKMAYDVIEGHWRWIDLSVPRKGHDIIISVQTMDITPRRAHPWWHAQHPTDVHITSKNRQVRKLQALKRCRTQISLTWPWKQVIGQTKVMAGTILWVSGKMQNFKD